MLNEPACVNLTLAMPHLLTNRNFYAIFFHQVYPYISLMLCSLQFFAV